MSAIWKLKEVVDDLSAPERALFDRIYEFYVEEGRLVLPEGLRDWAYSRFGECEVQKIVRVINKITFESTLFNELRARRPIDVKAKEDIYQTIEETKGDFFCDPLNKTPSDVFGRVEGDHAITASNIAKYDYLHGVIVFKKHTPFSFSKDEVRDYLKVAWNWIKRANEFHPESRYPFFMWNCLWKAGASIVHGHAQVLVSKKPYGRPAFFSKIRKSYEKTFNSEYLEDLLKVHDSLGLGFEVEGVKGFAHLTPIKEKEVCIVSKDFFSLAEPISKVLTVFYDLGVRSFNVAVYMPPISEEDFYLARIVDRGDPYARTVDIGGMELYGGTPVVASDPFKVVEFLK